MPLTVVMLAAGLGSRFGGAKQLAPLGPSGETLLDYNLHDARRAGFGRAVLVIRAELAGEMAGVVERWAGRMEIGLVEQRLADLPEGVAADLAGRARPWGTGQAVWAVRNAVTTPFAVANADDCYGPEGFAVLAEFLRRRRPDQARYALVGYPLSATLPEAGAVNRALLRVDPAGHLLGAEELIGIERTPAGGRARERELSGDALVSMNLWGFTPAVFAQLETGFRRFLDQHGADPRAEYPLPTAVDELIASGSAVVDVLAGGGRWCGVTHPEDRHAVSAFLREQVARGVYPPAIHP